MLTNGPHIDKQVVRRACLDEHAPDYLRMRITRSFTVIRTEGEA